MVKIHSISPKSLSWEVVENLVVEPYKLELSTESRQLIIKCRDYLDRKMESESRPIYGITTGFGSLCNKTISNDELSLLQKIYSCPCLQHRRYG